MGRVFLFALGAVLVGLCGALPFHQTDASKLVVIQTLVVSEDAWGVVTLHGPDGLTGTADGFDAAVEALAAHAPGQLFLGACEQLILTGASADCLADAARGGSLRPAVCVYFTNLAAEALAERLEPVTEYLSAHPGDVRMHDVRAALYEGRGLQIPRLQGKDGGYETV